MSSLLLYIALSSVCLMLFMLGFQLFLKNNTMFNLCRFYLIASILLSFLIPSLPIDIGIGSIYEKNIGNGVPTEIRTVEQNMNQGITQTTATSSINSMDIDFVKVFGIALLAISVLMFIRFLFRFGSIILIQNSGNRLESEDGLNLIFTDKTDNAFSFLKYIFINPLKFTDEEKRLIIEHEREHIRHFHSVDLIIIELLIVFQWFNPFAYIARRKLIEIHEFIADNGVIRNGADPYSYQNLLLSVVTSSCLPTAGNQLSALITKKRIAMIGKPMNQTGRWINFLVIIPIVALLIVGVSAFTPSKSQEKKVEARNEIQTVQNDTTSFKYLMSKAQHEVKDAWLKDFTVSLAPNSSQSYSVILKKECIYNLYYFSGNVNEKVKTSIDLGNPDQKTTLLELTLSLSTKHTISPKETGAYHFNFENKSDKYSNTLLVLTLHEMKENAVVETSKQITKDSTKEEEQLFTVVEQMPKFGDNDNDFRNWIAQNIKYPEEATKKGIQGRVFIQFVVEKDGRVTNAEIIKGADPLLDKEAIRVVQASPKWNPGKQKGECVKVKYVFPVTFSLQK